MGLILEGGEKEGEGANLGFVLRAATGPFRNSSFQSLGEDKAA